MQRPENGNTIRIRERHTLHTGEKRIKSYVATTATDLNAQLAIHATRLGDSLKEQEYQQYLSDIENNVTPAAPVEQTTTEIQSRVLRHILSLPMEQQNLLIIIRASSFINGKTDQQLIDLLTIDQAKVDEIRSNVTTLLAFKTFVQNYVPPLEEI